MTGVQTCALPIFIDLPLLNSEFEKNKVWVDANDNGSWAVYRKSINYQLKSETSKSNSLSYGSCVAHTDTLGYLIGDSGLGEVYRYTYNANTNDYDLRQTLTQAATFGSCVSYADDIFVISETSGNVYIYQLVSNTLYDQMNLLQTIAAPLSTTTWGASTSISGDKNWIFVGDADNNLVYAYKLSPVTDEYELITTLTDGGLVSGDQFGTSVVTDYYGDTVIVGAPKQDYDGLENVGFTYVFNRLTQNFEVTYNSFPFVPQTFTTASAPTTISKTATDTSEVGHANYIKVTGGLVGVNVDDPVVFSGTLLSSGAIQANKVYYVVAKSGSRFQISDTRGGTALTLATEAGGSMVCTFQTDLITVGVNGTVLTDDEYAVIGSTLYVYPALSAGDIVILGTNTFVEVQTLDSQTEYDIEIGRAHV